MDQLSCHQGREGPAPTASWFTHPEAAPCPNPCTSAGLLGNGAEVTPEERTTMRTRSGFARLLPLMAFAGLAAGTIVLLASARPVQAPPGRYSATQIRFGGDCYDAGFPE